MAGAQRKVIVRRFSPGLLRGYLPPTGFVDRETAGAMLNLFDLSGRMQQVPLSDVKMVHFVREFHSADESNPERLPRKSFLARPRTEGLWVRFVFRDGDTIEGLASLDLSLADTLADDLGIQIVPPDVRGNSQRIYIPRTAMSELQIVAVVTTPTRRKALERLEQQQAEAPRLQTDLFPLPDPDRPAESTVQEEQGR